MSPAELELRARVAASAVPARFHPLVSDHPAAAAWRVQQGGGRLTGAEEEAVCWALIALDDERLHFLTDCGGGTMPWAFEAGRAA